MVISLNGGLAVAQTEGATDESKCRHMERLVRQELERWESDSTLSTVGGEGYEPTAVASRPHHTLVPWLTDNSNEGFCATSR